MADQDLATKDRFEDIDFFADIEVTQRLPEYLAAMRDKSPVYKEPFHGVYMVTGMEEAMQIFQQQADAFSSSVAVTGPLPPLPFAPGGDVRGQIADHRGEMPWTDHLATYDGAEHAAFRGMMSQLLTHKRLKANEEYVHGLVERLVDSVIDRGGCEITEDFAHALSTLVIADLLGVPEEDRQSLLEAMGPDPTQMEGDQGFKIGPDPLVHLHGRFLGYLEERLANPRDDMLTGLAQATLRDGTDPGLTRKARLACFLFGAGQDTSARLVAFSFRVLGDSPDVQAKLRTEPHRVPEFVEEVLRFEPPVKTLSRLAVRDVEIGGVDIPKGAIVTICTGGVNRDPRCFTDPDRFDYDRPNVRDHVAFSRGSHACLGAPLARMEVRVALERFLQKTSDIRISEAHHGAPGARTYSYEPTYLLHGLQALHVEWDKA
ncbi:MAG: cytochrome P450 [Novosphingobium sp.]|nr:cytochrome P450 [Novosphingobium sp.]MCP5402545.1 cytochrome P450 [Novosphingobium sp.]